MTASREEPRYLTASELQRRFKIPRSSFYRYVAEGYLPRPVHIGPRCVRWRLCDVEAFEQRLAAERGSSPPTGVP